jgi:hypothetical protein
LRTVCLALSLLAPLGAAAEVFYAGDPKGLPGEEVNMTVNARAGTVLEGIDIVPDLAAVSSVLHFMSFTESAGLTDGGFPLCTGQACSVTYLPEKSFSADTVLATLRFRIDPAAAVGPVPFNPGVVVGVDDLPIAVAQNFEVLAVPEPAHWALLAAGLVTVAFGVRRQRSPAARSF